VVSINTNTLIKKEGEAFLRNLLGLIYDGICGGRGEGGEREPPFEGESKLFLEAESFYSQNRC